MARRTNDVTGYVNFPVDSKYYHSSNEGGLYVRLVVVEAKSFGFMECCGGATGIEADGTYLGDDFHGENNTLEDEKGMSYHFPRYGNADVKEIKSILNETD